MPVKIFDAGTYVFTKTVRVVGLDIYNIQCNVDDKCYPFLERDGSISMIMPDKQPDDLDYPVKILGYLSADHAVLIKSVMDTYECHDLTVKSVDMYGYISDNIIDGNSNRREMDVEIEFCVYHDDDDAIKEGICGILASLPGCIKEDRGSGMVYECASSDDDSDSIVDISIHFNNLVEDD